MDWTLVIGDKRLSSWSLRAWLALRLSGARFREVRVRLGQADTAEAIRAHSPSGKVPLLKTEDGPVWDSLAIAEYLAERVPERALWPRERAARALARACCAEMHSGFAALRSQLPMDLCRDAPLASLPAAVGEDIQRIVERWRTCRERFGEGGPFLFGEPGLADAFFAPVAARFRAYRVELPPAAEAYVNTIYQWPDFQAWQRGALEENRA